MQGRHSNAQSHRELGNRAALALQQSILNPYASFSHTSSNSTIPYPSYPYSHFGVYPNTTYSQTRVNSDGYSLSSTYNPAYHSLDYSPLPTATSIPASERPHNQRPRANTNQSSSWLTHGNHRCTYNGCKFTASAQSVEVHMMDRHLIFPADWDKRKPSKTWDGDPSLKGKPVSVFGTSIILDTPAAIDAWIEERRKRWPSATRVQEQKERKEEAVNRGEIQMEDLNRSTKRRRIDNDQQHRSSHRGRGRGRGSRGLQRHINRHMQAPQSGSSVPPIVEKQLSTDVSKETKEEKAPDAVAMSDEKFPRDDSESSSDNDEPPEEQPSTLDAHSSPQVIDDGPKIATHPGVNRRKMEPRVSKPTTLFGPKRSLLRNLLVPEIRHSVSVLSQAIHFIVENDFFEGVELNPGDSQSRLVEVMTEDPPSKNS